MSLVVQTTGSLLPLQTAAVPPEVLWHYTSMTRQVAERLLVECGVTGCFLVRDSETVQGASVLSVGCVLAGWLAGRRAIWGWVSGCVCVPGVLSLQLLGGALLTDQTTSK